MKRLTKKLLGATMSATMSLGMIPAVSAYAGTITVATTNPNDNTSVQGETYVAYKIFDSVKATGTDVTTGSDGIVQTADGPIIYKIDSVNNTWFGVLFNADGTAKSGNDWFTAVAIPGESGIYQVKPNASYDDGTDAKAAAEWLLANKASGENGTSLTVGQAATVADGYYLVTSSVGTNLGLATTDIPMTIVEKNTFPTVDKTQKDAEDNTAAYADTAVQVQVGDTVDYQIVVWVPATVDKDITVTDTMTAGLSLGANPTFTVQAGDYNDTTKVFAADAETELTATTDYVIGSITDTGFVATIKPTDSTKGKYVQISFSATVDADAIADTGKKNEVTLAYSNFSNTDHVKYQTYATGMVKYDGQRGQLLPDGNNALPANTTYLADAEFQLIDKDEQTVIPVSYDSTNGYYYPDANGTAVITSVANGTGIVIRGLDNQAYYLKETKAPNGYNLLEGLVTLVVADSDSTANDQVVLSTLTDASIAKVQNNAGGILPTTGGIGTTILYIVGGGLVIGAGVYLISKKRRSQNSDEE